MNDALVERKVEGRYATLCVMLWNPETREFALANAGALPPLICRSGEILKVRVEGVPIGLLENREYEEVAFQAHRGDILVLYSDGIPDHLNTAGTEYGRGRLAQIVRGSCHGPADALIQAIFDDMDRFATVAFDDQTLFVMKVQ
jgi:sigma-B regulation protein RsbU (phosphoserine phosphatase)